MRYFDDGDLTEGLAIAHKPYPFGLILGYWHAVSQCWDGERKSVDYDDPEAATTFRIQLERLDDPVSGVEGGGKSRGKGKGKGRRQPGDSERDDLMVTLHFMDWQLEYTGTYNTDGPATNLYLSHNETPEVGDVDQEATLAFGTVLDDRGYPFLRINLSACQASSGSDDMEPIEIVAKRTDTTEVHKLELSKNERLRLGYVVRADGVFEDPVAQTEPSDTYESLTRQLKEHTTASMRIIQQINKIRSRLDEQMLEAAESGQQIRNMYDDHRMSIPARTPGIARIQQLVGAVQKTPASAPPRPSIAPRASSSGGHQTTGKRARERFEGRTPHSAPPKTSKAPKGKRYCRSCDKVVSLSHGAWEKHIGGRRHLEQNGETGQAISKPYAPTAGRASSNRPGLQTRSSARDYTGRPARNRSLDGANDVYGEGDVDEEFNGDGGLMEQDMTPTNSRPSSTSASEPPRRRVSGGEGTGRFGGVKGPTQLCEVCDCQISVKNWNVHTKSNKHRLNSGGAALVNGALNGIADLSSSSDEEDMNDDQMDGQRSVKRARIEVDV